MPVHDTFATPHERFIRTGKVCIGAEFVRDPETGERRAVRVYRTTDELYVKPLAHKTSVARLSGAAH